MSGFGSGGSFGSQSQQPFGSAGFGASNGFGGGFAPPANNPSPQASINSTFGSAGGAWKAPDPGFGQPALQQQQHGSGPVMFGASANVVPPFGSSQPLQSSSGFGQSTTSDKSFGPSVGGSTSSPFGPSVQQGFSGMGNAGSYHHSGASPFGGGTLSHPPSSFQTPSGGNSAGNQFVGSSIGQSLQNPFGSIAGSTVMSFGASSSLMPSVVNQPFNRHDNHNTGSMMPLSGMSPFGATSRMAGIDEMEDDPAPASNLPFGTPVAVASSSSRGPPTRLPYPRGQNPSWGQTGAVYDNVETSKQELLSKLKAKKDKLLRLEEKKNKAKMSAEGASLNPNASVFVPGKVEVDKSLAEKNAIRFANTTNQATTRAMMPSELAGAPVDYASLRVEGRVDREILKDAVSLVGTCTYMCPDEELLRREREGDIQLLETPLPGTLHPLDWTYRNTVVKRFRRSAADYKLDVPEWIRPPEVLETVCGYLEEWVMERDRQGPDPRLPNGGTPPSLDVYQFIWDRTRMVRKDLTLQNYVGTGGNCDAKAVRCHERICRWHTMCEHQLSHIQEFVSMQSQQNIQELGQTMKTLNQLYDDSLGRSKIEVPDENGAETGIDLSGYNYGCRNDTVQGANPVDFDGTPLKNEPDTRSLIGTVSNHGPSRGTAEPEMRGLYILLTIDNDGGMEVLKYAARLFRDRPELYHSRPVQLALSIYKAKKENNYARFFKILRSSSTPYLFACLMFKHVEHMRKTAFKICNRAYGARTKEGETIYDSYPLKRWEKLLCYEGLDEARNACKHYNITVKSKLNKSSSGIVHEEEFISWKHSSFSEPRDPDKGVTIHLKPKKMIKTIERKLNGATRLAVCRGAVSGEGLILVETSTSPRLELDQAARKEKEKELLLQMQKEEMLKSRDREKKDMLLLQQREEEALQKRHEEERENRIEREKAEQQAAKLREEQEAERRRRTEDDLRRKAEKKERMRQERENEVARRKEEERFKLEAMEERVRLEKLQAERRVEAERLRFLEEQQRLAAIESERLRIEAERRRQEEARKVRDMEETRLRTERNLQEQIAIKSHSEWKEAVITARKQIFFMRMMNKIPHRLTVSGKTGRSLTRIDAKTTENTDLLCIERTERVQPIHGKGTRRILESLLRIQKPIDIHTILENVALDLFKSFGSRRREGSGGKLTLILTLSLQIISSNDHPMRDLVRRWIDFNFQFRHSFSSKKGSLDIRMVLFDCTEKDIAEISDAAIFVLPPSSSSDKSINEIAALVHNASNTLQEDAPRIAFVLSEECDSNAIFSCVVESKHFPPVFVEKVCSKRSNKLLSGLHDSLETVLREISLESLVVVSRVSIDRMCLLCVNAIIWQDSSLEAQDDFLTSAVSVLDFLIEEMDSFSQKIIKNWPPVEFMSEDEVVLDYFDEGLHLPASWHECLRRCVLDPKVRKVQHLFRGKLSIMIQKLLEFAPAEVVNDCMSMLEQRLVRRCFQSALCWAIKADDSARHRDEDCVYIPYGSLNEIIQRAAARFQANVEKVNGKSRRISRVLDEATSRTLSLTPRNGKSVNIFASEVEQTITDVHVDSNTTEETSQRMNTLLAASSDKKRSRDGYLEKSTAVTESKAFTKKLRAMAEGGMAREMVIGHTTLSSLLRDAQDVTSPK